MSKPSKIPCIDFEEWVFHKGNLALAAARIFEDSPIFEIHAARFRSLEAAAEILAEYQAECARSLAIEEKIQGEH